MDILLTQLEKKITHLLTENARLRKQSEVLQTEKSDLEAEQETLRCKHIALGEQTKQLETQLQAVEGRLFHLVSSVPTDEHTAAQLQDDESIERNQEATKALQERSVEQASANAQPEKLVDTMGSTNDTEASLDDDIFAATSNTQDESTTDNGTQGGNSPQRY